VNDQMICDALIVAVLFYVGLALCVVGRPPLARIFLRRIVPKLVDKTQFILDCPCGSKPRIVALGGACQPAHKESTSRTSSSRLSRIR
jgi:hypothetical protein